MSTDQPKPEPSAAAIALERVLQGPKALLREERLEIISRYLKAAREEVMNIWSSQYDLDYVQACAEEATTTIADYLNDGFDPEWRRPVRLIIEEAFGLPKRDECAESFEEIWKHSASKKDCMEAFRKIWDEAAWKIAKGEK